MEYNQPPFYGHVPGQQYIVQPFMIESHQAGGKNKENPTFVLSF